MTNTSAPARTPVRRSAAYELLHSLTVEQAQAVTHGEGPLLLFAGPGAGKTMTITTRIAHLVCSGIASVREILALTFTVRAAGEMRLRLADMLGEQSAAGLTVCTFHSLGARILREHAQHFERTASYTIYDPHDVARAIEALLADERRAELQAQLERSGHAGAELIREEISRAKNRLLTPESYRRQSERESPELVAAVWEQLEQELRLSNSFDLDDMLCKCAALLEAKPRLRAAYRARWPHVLVDEFQDTNAAQLRLVTLLCDEDGDLVVVGDDDQCIYSWRGAAPENILRFQEPFPRHRRLLLRENFRNRAEILRAAVRAVSHNARREPKALQAKRGAGGQVHVVAFASEQEEAAWVADQVARARDAGVAPQQIMVLARTSSLTRPLQAELAAVGVPYRVLGERGVFERSEVRDALAYLSLLCNPCDGAALARVASHLAGVGRASVGHLIAYARAGDGDVVAAAARAHEIDAIRRSAARASLREWGREMLEIRAGVEPFRSLSTVVSVTLSMRTGIQRVYEHRRDHGRSSAERHDAERVLEDLRSLQRAAGAYEEARPHEATLRSFLEHAALLETEEVRSGADERFTISTVHRAKGTQAQVVFLLGCEEGLLPHRRALEAQDGRALEEEARTFYVACTRAGDILVMTVCAAREGRACAGISRFLVEAGLVAPPPASGS